MENGDRDSTTGKAGRDLWTAMHYQRCTHQLSPLCTTAPHYVSVPCDNGIQLSSGSTCVGEGVTELLKSGDVVCMESEANRAGVGSAYISDR